VSPQTAAAIAKHEPIAPKMSALDTMVSQLAKEGEFTADWIGGHR
jgi:hypothetical protein